MTQNQKIYKCLNGCGAQIFFDDRKSASGKAIPLQKNIDGTLSPHKCPNKQQQGDKQTLQTLETLEQAEQESVKRGVDPNTKGIPLEGIERDCGEIFAIEQTVRKFLNERYGANVSNEQVGMWVKLIWEKRHS